MSYSYFLLAILDLGIHLRLGHGRGICIVDAFIFSVINPQAEKDELGEYIGSIVKNDSYIIYFIIIIIIIHSICLTEITTWAWARDLHCRCIYFFSN